MRPGHVAASAFLLASVALARSAHAQLELKNDGFTTGAQVDFEGGFHDGEIGASRFLAPGPRQLQAVQLLFGGNTATRTITLQIWDDSQGGSDPGAMIYEGDFELTGANDAMQSLDLSGENVFVPAQFRAGIQFQGAPDVDLGYPSIARDIDGSIAADKNYLYAVVAGQFHWYRSKDLGLQGDWVIRAVVADSGGTPDAGVTIDASPGTPDAGGGGPDAGGGSCNGNGDCDVGEYCDLDTRACTFDCRHDTDCPDNGQCNSLGQCIA
ncbi:MAG TPA: hypothetical protein VHE35_10100, partial [Kofleriaceae bacterium]|nr:hypothetical protein [Kofleriaceae bacterium]